MKVDEKQVLSVLYLQPANLKTGGLSCCGLGVSSQTFMGEGLNRARDPLWISRRETTTEMDQKRKAGGKSVLELDIWAAHLAAIETQIRRLENGLGPRLIVSTFSQSLAQLVRLLVCTFSFVSFSGLL